MIRVILSDNSPVVRQGWSVALDGESDVGVVAEASDAAALLRAARGNAVDVALVDVRLPGMPFSELVLALRRVASGILVVAVASSETDPDVLMAVRAGAAGCICKSQSLADLAPALRQVHAGRRYVCQDCVDQLANALDDTMYEPHECLSPRELGVVRLLASGERPKEIARLLHLSPKTVSTYRARALVKLGLHANAQLVRYALEHHLLDVA